MWSGQSTLRRSGCSNIRWMQSAVLCFLKSQGEDKRNIEDGTWSSEVRRFLIVLWTDGCTIYTFSTTDYALHTLCDQVASTLETAKSHVHHTMFRGTFLDVQDLQGV